ncbi:MAG: pilus assembly protein PilM [Candidatus Omnitrophota bacterium]
MKINKGEFISIDFGRAFIKAACIGFSGGKAAVIRCGLIKAPPPDEGPADSLKAFLRDNSFSCKEAILNIWDTEKVFIKSLVLTAVPKQEMLEALKWQIKAEVPFNIEDAVFDLQVIKEYSEEEGAKKDGIICIAAERGFINRYLAIAAECNLQPIRISSGPFNYANILNFIPDKPPVTAVLDMGHNQAVLSIYKDNKLNFVRSLPVSFNKLIQSLSGTLVSDKGKIELTPEKALGLIEKYGIPMDESAVLEDNIGAIHIISLMRPHLEGLAKEIKRSFDYFASNFKEESAGALYITGGGANLKNLGFYLNKELAMPVSALPLPEAVDIAEGAKEGLDNQRNQIISAIGAALAGKEAVDLLPHEIKTKKAESVQKSSLRIVSIIAAAIFLFFLFVFSLEIGDCKLRLKAANAQLETMREVKALKRKIELRQSLIHKIKLGKVPVFGLFKVISSIIPGNIFITELSLDQQRHILVLKGRVLAGANTAESELTDLAKKLEGSSFFREATLVSSANISGIQEFEITCDLKY